MPFFGQVVQHQRVDVRNAPQADGATVLFLYSRDFWGVVYETYIVKIIRVSSFGAAILPQ